MVNLKLVGITLLVSMAAACGKAPSATSGASSTSAAADPVSCTTAGGVTITFSGGSGTSSDPFLISNTTDLGNIGFCPSAAFKMTASVSGSYPAVTLTPLGPVGFTFSGTFDGNGYTISNFNLHWTAGAGGTGDNYGLFGINTGTVKNLTTSNVVVTGHNNVGVLVGDNQGVVLNCTTAGGATGNQDVGGVAGEAIGGSVQASSSTATVSGSSNTGQIVGLTL